MSYQQRAEEPRGFEMIKGIRTESMMAAINERVVNSTVGDKVALALFQMGYAPESAGRIGLLYDQGVRDIRMPDAALVLGEQFQGRV